jgi:hypothetical protein
MLLRWSDSRTVTSALPWHQRSCLRNMASRYHATLRKWMVEDGLWLSRKQRRSFHQPRLRRECYGELIQIDGSDHRWFEDRSDQGSGDQLCSGTVKRCWPRCA